MLLKRFFLFSLLLFCSFSFGDFFSKKTYVYDEFVNNGVIRTNWTLKTKDKTFVIEGTNSEGITNITASSDFGLMTYSFRSIKNPTDYQYSYEGGKLQAQGTVKGESLREVYQIGKTPWIQEFTFGLKPFVSSNKREMDFVVINPDDFSLQNLSATKEGIETVTVQDTKYQAQKIHISLHGFASLFWSADIFYDLTSGDLLIYEGEKSPETPKTVIKFHSKK